MGARHRAQSQAGPHKPLAQDRRHEWTGMFIRAAKSIVTIGGSTSTANAIGLGDFDVRVGHSTVGHLWWRTSEGESM